MTLVDVVIPTIGRPSLEEAVCSLTDQTDPDWFGIVMKDGHETRSLYNIQHYKPGVEVWTVDKTGSAGLTRDYGIDRSIERGKAEWVGFLDDDDRLAPTYVERLRTFSEQPWDIIVFQMLHPTRGAIPDDEALFSGEISWTNVGISFAVRSDFLLGTGLRFGREDVTRPGPEGNEDIRFLKTALQDYEAMLIVDQTIQYYVRNAKENDAS